MYGMATPCKRVCRMHKLTEFCLGCGRTRDEIARWAYLPAGERAQVEAELAARLSVNADTPESGE